MNPTPGQRMAVFACVVVALAAVGVYLTAPGLFGGGSQERPPGGSAASPSTRAAAPVPQDDSPRQSPPGPGASATATPTASASTRPTPAVSPSATYTKVVLRFARTFTRTDRSAEEWHDAVARYCTRDLAHALSYTDPRTVPHGSPTGDTRLVGTDENAVQVAVPLDSGASILVTVTRGDGDYTVSDVRPEKR